MPNMTGFELYEKIKSMDNKTQVCFITAYEEYISDFKRLCPKLEVDCFIKKPIEVQHLVQIVRSRLDPN
jgi:response regulator RpfG family c-di-GMP phosphodiesterase